MRKESFFTLTASVLLAWSTTQAQTEQKATFMALQHLELSVKGGTTGYGFDLATPLCDFARLRTGFTYIPRIEVPMSFGIQVGNDASKSKSKFETMRGFLEKSFLGWQEGDPHIIDSEIDMIGRPHKFWNWNVMVDFFPLKNNKHWHITAGFSLGPAHIAEAYNTTEDMQSLLAVKMYNSMYSKLINDQIEAFPELLYEAKLIDLSALGINASTTPEELELIQRKLRNNGRMGMHVGNYAHDVYYQEDVVVQLTVPKVDSRDKPVLDENGNQVMEVVDEKVLHKKGDIMHHKGDPYFLEPDKNGMAKASMKVNRFKPYLGLGYEGRLAKNDDRWKIGFDAGVLFWGGVPEVRTHDGIDLTSDVENINGKVGDYVDVVKKFKVYPVLNLRLTYKLF